MGGVSRIRTIARKISIVGLTIFSAVAHILILVPIATVSAASCPTGQVYSSGNCYNNPTSIVNSCPSGGNFNGSVCVTSSSYGATASTGYSCNSGDTGPSGTTCTHTNSYGATATDTCPSGSSQGVGGCVVSQGYGATGTPDCGSLGFDPNNPSNCLDLTSGTSFPAPVTYSCPSGGNQSGSWCDTSYTVASTTTYSCPGSIIPIGTTCTEITSYGATASTSYSCNSGDPGPSGTTCTHTTSYAATATCGAKTNISGTCYSLVGPANPDGAVYKNGTGVANFNAVVGDSINTNSSTAFGTNNNCGSITYAISPALPAGLSMNSGTGIISGVASSPSPVTTYTITATCVNSGATATETFSGVVTSVPTCAAPTVLAVITPSPAVVGASYSGSINLNNATGFTNLLTLPAGLSAGVAVVAGAGIGIPVTGTPTANVTNPLTLDAVNNCGGGKVATNANSLSAGTLTVVSGAISLSGNTIPSTVAAPGSTITPVDTSKAFTMNGCTAVSYAISPSPPAGFSFNTATGILTGASASILPSTTYTVTASCTRSDGVVQTQSSTFTLAVNAIPNCPSPGNTAIQMLPTTDCDGDGLTNQQEGYDPNGDGSTVDALDTDGDGVPNYLDTDSDGDGISDAVESGCVAGVACVPVDSDGDGIPNYLDTDSDNDGVSDVVEGSGDFDGDGIPNYLDTDSDGDGTPDSAETPLSILNACLPSPPVKFVASANCDSDHDGISDAAEGRTATSNGPDTDGDGIPDYLDTDSDNDGVLDIYEVNGNPALGGQTSNRLVKDTDGDGYQDNVDTAANNPCLPLPLRVVVSSAGCDSDNDGIPDSVEGLTADTDGDGIPNYLDTDSDGDGIPDAVESGCVAGSVCVPKDTDGDGIPDYLDTDSDGDGIPDYIEDSGCVGVMPCTPTDTDGDGIPNYLDTDSNNDGIPDSVQKGANCKSLTDCTLAVSYGGTTPDVYNVDFDGDGTLNQNEPNVPGANTDPCIPNRSASACHDQDGDGYFSGLAPTDPKFDPNDTNPCIPSVDDAPIGSDCDGDGIPRGNPNEIDDTNPCVPVQSPVPKACQNKSDDDNDGIPNSQDPSPENPCLPDASKAPATADCDGDGLTNKKEKKLGTNPNNPNTDYDNLSDGVEVFGNPANFFRRSDPKNACDPDQVADCPAKNIKMNRELAAIYSTPKTPDTGVVLTAFLTGGIVTAAGYITYLEVRAKRRGARLSEK